MLGMKFGKGGKEWIPASYKPFYLSGKGGPKLFFTIICKRYPS